VCEYLLKPITTKNLEQTLKSVEKEISMGKMLADGFVLMGCMT